MTTVAPLKDAGAVAVGPAGDLYITSGQQVFQLSAGGVLTVVAGHGAEGYTGDGGPRHTSFSQLRHHPRFD